MIYHGLSLYTGIAGFELGLKAAAQRAGHEYRVACYVEMDRYCQTVLDASAAEGQLDVAPLWPDARTFHGRPWCGCVDILTAGFPCQPWSVAGLRRQTKDDRNLWSDTRRIIWDVRPSVVVLENVPGLLTAVCDRGLWEWKLNYPFLGQIFGELAEAGYDAVWDCVSLPELFRYAPHRRKRLWIVAYATRIGVERHRPTGEQESAVPVGEGVSGCDGGRIREPWSDAVLFECKDGKYRPVKRKVCGMVDGVSRRMDAEVAMWATPTNSGTGREDYCLQGKGGWDIQSQVKYQIQELETCDIQPLLETNQPDRVNRLKALGNAVVPAVVERIGDIIFGGE